MHDTLLHLPLLNATLNTCSALLLALGYLFIRQKRREAHRRCMLAAFVTSSLFLVSYLIYHFNAGRIVFREPAAFRPIYLGILITHTILAAAVVPMVLLVLARAVRGNYEGHRVIARWTWPVWMYVSITGVAIYLILYVIYPQAR